MVSNAEKINVLIVGASGHLGSLITQHALKKPNLQVSILVRDLSKASTLADEVKKAGGQVIKGDLSDPSSLKGVTKGFHTVASAISSLDEKTNVDGHIALIDDAVKNGVTRFVPSHFGSDTLSSFTKEELARSSLIVAKAKIQSHLDATPLKQFSISNGQFMEFFSEHKGYWGEADQVLNFTTYDDTAAFTAAALADKDATGLFRISGDDLTFTQVVESYNRLRGTNVTAKRLGSLVDLRKLYDDTVTTKDANPVMVIFLGLFSLIFDDRAVFKKKDNSRYPEIKFTTFGEFIQQHPEKKLQE